MNRFLEHHAPSLRFVYSSFDRILLNAIIQPFQNPATVVWFFRDHRGVERPLSSTFFRELSADYHSQVQEYARQLGVPIVEPPKNVRREEWVAENYFAPRRDQPGLAVILKSRENANVIVSEKTTGAPHLELKSRFVWQYYFYLHDAHFGRMFLRICPYFPFNSRICLNGHHWLAQRLQREGIGFRREENAFLDCDDPARLQTFSDQLGFRDIVNCVQPWFRELLPFFSAKERQRYSHRLFVSQIEYCTNLVFERRAGLDRMLDRLLDLNRSIGRPDRMATIFGRRIYGDTVGTLKTKITQPHLANPCLRSEYKNQAVKLYVRNHTLCRAELVSNNVRELGVNKSVEGLSAMRETMAPIVDRFLDVQQDVLETFVDREHWRKLGEATLLGTRRVPGLRLDDRRLVAVMGALVRHKHLATGGTFRTKDLQGDVALRLERTVETYTLSQLRYDLGKLRAKGLVEKVAGTQTYRLTAEGYRVCILYLKLSERLYAPLVSGLQSPQSQDAKLTDSQRSKLDRLYVGVEKAIDKLCAALGLVAAQTAA